MWRFVKIYLLMGPVVFHLGQPILWLCGILLRTKKVFTHDTDEKSGVRITETYREGEEEEVRPSGELAKSLTE